MTGNPALVDQMVIKYGTLSLSQQVLERQEADAGALSRYLTAHAQITDSTGALLSLFDPLSQAAVAAASESATGLGKVERAMAAACGDTADDLQDTDGQVHNEFGHLLGRLGRAGTNGPYTDLGGPTLGAAGTSAGSDYGDVDSTVVDKVDSTLTSIRDGVSGARDLIGQARNGASGQVTELVNASSYLVEPQAPDDPVSDLRWSAGALLGSIDWVAEQFIGFSILDRCVFHPLAGDWKGVFKCAEAWQHAGDAVQGIAKNHSGLVANTPPTWRGESGDAFRVAMTTLTGTTYEISMAFGLAGDLVEKIARVTKLACSAIGAALKFIADKLLKMAAEASTPVIGWAVGALTAYNDIQDVIKKVRLVNTILNTIASAIQDFVSAKTSILDKVAIVENLVQGASGSATS